MEATTKTQPKPLKQLAEYGEPFDKMIAAVKKSD